MAGIASLALAFCPPAAAQTREQQVAWCLDNDGTTTAELVISACTDLLQSGQEPAASIPIYFHHRGVAHGALGQRAQAIADYDQAIRLEPQDARGYLGRAEAYDKLGDSARAAADRREAERLGQDR
jgi:Flp pilus assembly protein TadD